MDPHLQKDLRIGDAVPAIILKLRHKGCGSTMHTEIISKSSVVLPFARLARKTARSLSFKNWLPAEPNVIVLDESARNRAAAKRRVFILHPAGPDGPVAA
jgi:hypothetical protein